MNVCQNCSHASKNKNLVIKNLPVSNAFVKKKNAKIVKIDKLTLFDCPNCLLLQIKEKIPLALIKPKKNVHIFREPESHLDDFLKIYKKKYNIKINTVVGVTYKDKTLVDRFKKISKISYIIEPRKDLNIDDKGVNTETIITKITRENILRLKNKIGKVDLIIARHFIEHSHNAKKTLEILKGLLSESGKIILEVPESSVQLTNYDYTMLWEEHCLYFHTSSFKEFLNRNNFNMHIFKKYNYPVENVQICLISKKLISNYKIKKTDKKKYKTLTNNYYKKFNEVKLLLNNFFKKQSKHKKIYIYGGGHYSVMFVHIFQLSKYIKNIIDDNDNKKNMLLPGTDLKIVNSNILDSTFNSLCFLAFHPDNVNRIIKKNKKFIKNGNSFLSIFPNSRDIINYLT